MDPETGRRRRGRPPQIDVDAIARAALAELDGLSVAAVARRLGVAQGALYHHVEGRRDLVRLAADEALRDWCAPQARSWSALLHALGESLRRRIHDYPGLDEALLALSMPPPRLAAQFEVVVARLVDDGVDEPLARDAVHLVAHLAHEQARSEQMASPGESDRLRRRIDLVVHGVTGLGGSSVRDA